MSIKMKNKRIMSIAMVALILTVGTFGTVFAEDGNVTKTNNLEIKVEAGSIGEGGEEGEVGGSLNLYVPNLSKLDKPIKLSSEKQTAEFDFEGDLVLTDLRGTHEGYSLTVSATTPINESDVSLPTGSITLLSPVSITETDVTPTISQNKETAIDSGEVKVVTASEGQGMGKHSLKLPENALKVSVGPNTRVGTYSSVITWTLSSTP